MRKILLADSDPALRAVLTEQLGMNDEFSVVEAETGQEALELASQEYFDALLLDVSLPDMEGQDLCRRLRRSGVKIHNHAECQRWRRGADLEPGLRRQ